MIERRLAEDPVFGQLAAADRDRIAEYLERVGYRPGDIVVREKHQNFRGQIQTKDVVKALPRKQ